jgi:predicted transcriptional regulator
MTEETSLNTIELATELTAAWLGNQNVRASAEEVPAFLRAMHATLTELDAKGAVPTGDVDAAPDEEESFTPAVTVRKSLASPDHILSMIDGKPYKTLRRHLARHGLTPEQYRERYKLKADYPMVAPTYSEARRAMAHGIGLGQQGRAAKAAAGSKPAPAKRTPRSQKADIVD